MISIQLYVCSTCDGMVCLLTGLSSCSAERSTLLVPIRAESSVSSSRVLLKLAGRLLLDPRETSSSLLWPWLIPKQGLSFGMAERSISMVLTFFFTPV